MNDRQAGSTLERWTCGAGGRVLPIALLVLCAGWAAARATAAEGAKLLPGEEVLPLPTLGGTQFWGDELFFHGWHIQRNVLTGHCRLLDAKNLCYASGDYLQCRLVLDKIKRQQKLPPMRGKAVVLLHGLGACHFMMDRMAAYLREQGGYEVVSMTYPSTRQDVASHAWALARVVEHLDGIEEINFVAHSLGNIIVRHYLGDHTDAATHRQGDPRLRRIVMLGPPNQGAIAATALADNELFMAVAGPSGQQLGRDWAALQGRLATPQCEFGIIAGGLGNEHGFNPLLPGDNDFILTVASTRLAGARDFIVVPVVHNLEPHDPRVMQYTLRFLQHGYFKSAAERHPIAAAAMSKR